MPCEDPQQSMFTESRTVSTYGNAQTLCLRVHAPLTFLGARCPPQGSCPRSCCGSVHLPSSLPAAKSPQVTGRLHSPGPSAPHCSCRRLRIACSVSCQGFLLCVILIYRHALFPLLSCKQLEGRPRASLFSGKAGELNGFQCVDAHRHARTKR